MMSQISVKSVTKQVGISLLGYFLLLTVLAALIMNEVLPEGWLRIGCLVCAGILASANMAVTCLRKRQLAEGVLSLGGTLLAAILLGFLFFDTVNLQYAGGMLLALSIGAVAALMLCENGGKGTKKRKKRHSRRGT